MFQRACAPALARVEAMRGRGRSRIAARFDALNKLFERLDECFPHVRPPSENIPVGCREGAILRRRTPGKTLGVKEAERCHFSRSGPIQASVTRLADWPPPACPARSRCRS